MTKGCVSVASLLLLAVPVCVAQTPTPAPAPVPLSTGLSSTNTYPRNSIVDGGIPVAASDGTGPNFWVNADYLLWYVKKSPIPIPLITSGNPTDPVPGALGQPGTTVLFGPTGVNYNQFSGLRINVGATLMEGFGVEGGYFALERRSKTASFTDPTGEANLFLPFYGVSTGLGVPAGEASEQVSGPGYAGQAAVTTTLRLQGWDANLSYSLVHNDYVNLTLLGGFRTLNLNESLSIYSVSILQPGAAFGHFTATGSPFDFVSYPATVPATDSFHTYNNFYGGQLGARASYTLGSFVIDGYAKVGLGTTQQVTVINGSSSLIVPGAATVTVPGGVYALSSNSGRGYHESFSVVPEAGFNIGYKVTDWAAVRVGYTFLYWTNVQRPGEAIDRVVNQSLVPTDFSFGSPGGANRPVFVPQTKDFWAQGINFGLEFSF